MSKGSKSTSKAEPFAPIQPFIERTGQRANNLFNKNRLAERVIPFGQTAERGLSGLESYAGNNPITGQAQSAWGDLIGMDPYSGIQDVRNSISAQVLPQVAGMFGQGGFANSSSAQQTAAGALGNALAPFEYDQFNRGVSRQMDAINMAPMVSGLKYNDLQALLGAGGMRDDKVQQKANLPFQNVQNATNIFGALGGLGGTQTQGSKPGLLETVGTIGAAAAPFLAFCDRRLKTDIERVGTWRGVAIYTFRYLWENVRRIGPMAQEVPDRARVVLPGGILAVDMGAI